VQCTYKYIHIYVFFSKTETTKSLVEDDLVEREKERETTVPPAKKISHGFRETLSGLNLFSQRDNTDQNAYDSVFK